MAVSESVVSLCWAAPRAAIPELRVVRDQIARKFTKEWVMEEEAHASNLVNPKVRDRLAHKVSLAAYHVEVIVISPDVSDLAAAFQCPETRHPSQHCQSRGPGLGHHGECLRQG